MAARGKNYFADNLDWKTQFREAMRWEVLLPLYGETNKDCLDQYEEVLSSTGHWCSSVLAKRAAALDEEGHGTLDHGKWQAGPLLRETLNDLAKLGINGLSLDRIYGGQQAPLCLSLFVFYQFSRASIGASTYIAFTTAFADMLHRYADDDICKKYIPKIISGELSGSMSLTEPGCGSDLGAIRTVAKPLGNGNYQLTGTKIFITNGGGGLGLVLARIKGADEGLAGLSLFFVEQFSDGHMNYRVTKLEQKMGMKCSATCEVVFEDTPARLIGEPGQGFKLMLHLMNEARISVGLQSLGVMDAALDDMVEYAAERKQFGKTLLELPLYRKNLENLETRRDGFRAYLFDTISWFDIYQRLDLKKIKTGELTGEEQSLYKKAYHIVRRRTPLTKYFGSEEAVQVALKAVQGLGGYGYMEEYPNARYLRDAIGGLLYEGTSQIQSLMVLKDFMKTMTTNPGLFLQNWLATHPFAKIKMSDTTRRVRAMEYGFNKALLALLWRCFKPQSHQNEKSLTDLMTHLGKVFSKKNWFREEGMTKLMEYAELICEGQSLLEVLKSIDDQIEKIPTQKDLFWRYEAYATPRFKSVLEAIGR
jgi:alkylation response protein AidB-like acyl-CoA dehydrogenase